MLKPGDVVKAHIGPKSSGTDIVGTVLEEVTFGGPIASHGYRVRVDEVSDEKQSWAIGKLTFVKEAELCSMP
jgi:hypothetical protein